MSITILPLKSGTNQTCLTNLKAFWQAAWGDDPQKLGRIALITLTTTVDSTRESIEIAREYYSIGGVTPTSAFCIGSVTKVFTGTLLAFRINDEGSKPPYTASSAVNAWLPPPVKSSTRKISQTTLSELATHTSCMMDRTAGMNAGLYDNSHVPPNREQCNQWLDDKNWMTNCSGDRPIYSNWGSLTLAWALAQPDKYDYEVTLGKFITSKEMFDMPHTNTLTSTKTVQGYTLSGSPATGSAHGIRSNVQDMSTFIANYLAAAAANRWGPGFNPKPSSAQNKIYPAVNTAMTQYFPASGGGDGLSLDWYMNRDPVTGAIRYTKNGMTGEQGFSAWVGFAVLPSFDLTGSSYTSVGSVVLINKAMKGAPRNAQPVWLGQQTIDLLLGTSSNACPAAAPPDLDDDDDPVASPAIS